MHQFTWDLTGSWTWNTTDRVPNVRRPRSFSDPCPDEAQRLRCRIIRGGSGTAGVLTKAGAPKSEPRSFWGKEIDARGEMLVFSRAPQWAFCPPTLFWGGTPKGTCPKRILGFFWFPLEINTKRGVPSLNEKTSHPNRWLHLLRIPGNTRAVIFWTDSKGRRVNHPGKQAPYLACFDPLFVPGSSSHNMDQLVRHAFEGGRLESISEPLYS